MDSATLLKRARVDAGLSQRELAAAAETSASAVCLYENGMRIPRIDTLARLLAATGNVLVLDTFANPKLDSERNGRVLLQVIELAELLPFEPAATLNSPVFAELAG